VTEPYRYHFFRSGGVDQVTFASGSDVVHLRDLDHKLWVALAMPTANIAIAAETLACLDGDGDGRIRIDDIRVTISWLEATFVDPGSVLKPTDTVPLAAIKDAAVLAAAKRILSDLGKRDATSISAADTAAITKAFTDTVLNGDGIVIPASTEDAALRGVIEAAIAGVGSVADRSGKPGIDRALADKFFAEVDAYAAWHARGETAEVSPVGAATAAAADALAAVRGKLEDFFVRCRVAAYAKFDERTLQAVDTEPAVAIETAVRALTTTDEELAKLPVARITQEARVPLRDALNPAWADRMRTFADACVTPLLGARDSMSEAELATIVAKLAPYSAWLATRPVTQVDVLGPARVAELAAGSHRKQLADLIDADAALAGEYAQISAVSKAVLLQRDFARVLRSFVNFSDFYSKQDGVFQCGTLYLDARRLRLCVPVADAAKHAALAAASDACLLYCDVVRKGQTKQIVAALTNGDADNLFVGRNGVFYDRDGQDWDATITKIISNPISVRAAFWAPYKKLVKTIEDNVQKRAQAADEVANKRLEATGADVANADKEALADAEGVKPVPAKTAKIDLGTIAAIGVAIGGIGTLVGALLTNLFGLGVWLPFGVIAIMLMVSGPSMLLAWLKLRRRNLGPILDANGWAINGRARINVAFGAAMTELAKLPAGARRSLDDPFADKRTPWRRWVVLFAIVGLGGGWYLGKLDDYLPRAITSVAVLGDAAPASHRDGKDNNGNNGPSKDGKTGGGNATPAAGSAAATPEAGSAAKPAAAPKT
jgi:hypothetical protein